MRFVLKQQEGQALLIVVLVIVVALTVTLSVVSRSIVNLKTSVQQTDSQKALAAAEAGIEQAIKTGSKTNITLGNANTTSITATDIGSTYSSNTFSVYGGNTISRDDGAYVWLSPYPINYSNAWSGNLTVYWGDSSGASNNPAVEIVVLSGTSASNAIITKYAVDPYGARGNNFSSPTAKPGCSIDASFGYSYNLSITNGLIMKVIPLYKSTKIGICDRNLAPNPNLPKQGQVITATAKSGDVQRKVTVFQGFPELPAELFPNNLLSF